MTTRIFSLMGNLKICVAVLGILQFCHGSRLSDYLNIRNKFKLEEDELLFGSKIKLSNEEQRVNRYLMSLKYQEVDEGFRNPSTFLPAKNFLDVREKIQKSAVYKMIQKMPKGAVLHVHELCLTSLDFIVGNLTHLPNLYACLDNNRLQFHFLEKPTKDCNWTLMEDLRKNNVLNDIIIKQHFVSLMNKIKNESDQNAIWTTFSEMFKIAENLILYRPAFELYLYQGLQELYDDNVMYVEIRLGFAGIYEINMQDSVKYIKTFTEVVDKFVKEHPNFLGAKIIYSFLRRISHQNFDYVERFKSLKRAFPDWIVGFDFVGQEDLGEPLLSFAEKLLELGDETKFYFHAGETNWNGQPTDENLIDAVLLKSRRIGHGMALLKHPKVLEMVKNYSIAIEVNPVSSQVLKYTGDLRHHPASYFFANDFPVVVSNDDPSFWGVKGLSDDFYEAFIGIMSRKADLRALKQLAINSIIYSSMNKHEQTEALKKWEMMWNEFIKSVSQTHVP